jgi:hypothetical protein
MVPGAGLAKCSYVADDREGALQESLVLIVDLEGIELPFREIAGHVEWLVVVNHLLGQRRAGAGEPLTKRRDAKPGLLGSEAVELNQAVPRNLLVCLGLIAWDHTHSR